MFPAALVLVVFGELSWRALFGQWKTFANGEISANTIVDRPFFVQPAVSIYSSLTRDTENAHVSLQRYFS